MPRSTEAQPADVVTLPAPKLPPPEDITPEQAQVWRAIVDRLPSAWFADSTPLLRELVRHITYARKCAEELEAIRDKKGPKNRQLFAQLLRAHALQSRAIGDLSTRLRLTVQSADRDKAATMRRREVEGPKPWEDWRTAW
jgi:hypothetical protein